MTKLAYDVEEAAEATGLSRSFLNAAIRDGRLPAKTTKKREKDKARGGKQVITATALQAFIDGLEDA